MTVGELILDFTLKQDELNQLKMDSVGGLSDANKSLIEGEIDRRQVELDKLLQQEVTILGGA